MAFTKKVVKKAASYTKTAKAPVKVAVNYARKKAEEELEVEEVEEIEGTQEEQDDVQDDYDGPEEAPRQNSFSRRGPASRQSSQREPGKALRLTGLFAGKREGCFSGKLRDEDASNLAALIQEAQGSGQQIVFFLWENQGNPQFSLTANISTAHKKSWGNKGGGWSRGGQGNGGNFNRGFRRY